MWWLVYVAPDLDYYRLHANVLFRRGVAEIMGLSVHPADVFAYFVYRQQSRRQAVACAPCGLTAGCRSPGAVDPENQAVKVT